MQTQVSGRDGRGRAPMQAVLGLMAAAGAAAAQGDTLLGDWGGRRGAMEQAGLSLEATASVDVMAAVDGGADTGVDAPATFDLIAHLDTAAAGWWANGTFTLSLLGTAGGDPSDRIGDLQGASSLQAPDTVRVFEAWYEHRWLDDRVALLLGLHDLNSDFYALEYSGLFMNGSFGIGPELAQAGA